MAEPENQTLRLLRELRDKSDSMQSEMREGFENLSERLKNLQQAMIGESILGRYTVAEVEERLTRLEQRVSKLEKPR
jgi:polyhydroxyalkanoate synthesis regulator phasin